MVPSNNKPQGLWSSGFSAEERGENVLSGVGPVVHQEELDVVGVADDEGLVARGHHVLGLLVGAIADL